VKTDEGSGVDANMDGAEGQEEATAETDRTEGTTIKPRSRTAIEIQKRATRNVLALEKWANHAGGKEIKGRKRRGATDKSTSQDSECGAATTVGGISSEDVERDSVRASASEAMVEEEYFRSKEELLRLALLSAQHSTIQSVEEEDQDLQMDINASYPMVGSQTHQTSGALCEALKEAESFAMRDIRELNALVRSRGIIIPVEGSLLEKAERQIGTGESERVEGGIGGLLKMVHRNDGGLGDTQH